MRELIVARPELIGRQRRQLRPGHAVSGLSAGHRHVRRQGARADAIPPYRDQLQQHNDLNRRIFERVAAEAFAGRGVAIGFTDNYRLTDYGEPISALKSYVLSPFADPTQMETVVAHVLEALQHVEAG